MLKTISDILLHSRVGEVLFILLATVVAIIVTRKVLSFLRKFSKNDWITLLCDVLFAPSRWLIAGIAIFTAVEVVLRHNQPLAQKMEAGKYIFVIAVVTWLLFKWKEQFEKIFTQRRLRISKNKKDDRILISAVSKIITVFIATVAGVMILEKLGVPFSALFAFGGMSGIAVSWAAKDIVANFFGGFMIYLNRPFVIGDWIKSSNKGFEGTVEDIGWYMTCIRTFENRPLYIPNALITDAIIENPGRMHTRRMKIIIALRYDDIGRVKKIVGDLEAMLRRNPEIDQTQTLRVNLVSFDDYSIGVEVYTFTKATGGTEFRRVQQDVLFSIADIVEKNGAEMAFPTSVIEIKKD